MRVHPQRLAPMASILLGATMPGAPRRAARPAANDKATQVARWEQVTILDQSGRLLCNTTLRVAVDLIKPSD